MILLDTNVISEPQRREPDARVIDWIDGQALETLYLSTITVAELRSGIALMPAGKRRNNLHENLEKHLLPMFSNRILPFDMACTKAYADLLVKSRATGLAVETADAFIAAVAITNGFAVATRDTTPFEAAGLNVINPWETGC
ncbi:type II toxin-antitoxin system VapC family toxin [Acidithiobacillus sp. HP-6]|uniref:type II toxin-antitoxin system VapC family toxin n=1 Tax=unclassified Acidithiobacillus TaxID=2614800 RepID=UPI001879702C|nr:MULTISPECIES: type II toxin-antitoxin system VapC family toxin [unclassified Acidithiobacillus]MBE7561666.1 type II toxin-antitoxin system VapC family toxin [Acidithiobacillus sp. HP-6]MBE7568420.1 type II toxin-antitoxin system VapC family toxin [Acidithiobacillus sp. HP-2]